MLRLARDPNNRTDLSGKDNWAAIVRLGGVGDNLIAASVLGPLVAQGYRIEVITQAPQSCVFENNPYISKLSIKQTNDLPQGNMLAWQQWFETRSHEYDKFFNLSHSCEGILALFPAMTWFYWPPAMRRQLCGRSYLEFVHDICGVPYDFGRLFWPTAKELDLAHETRQGLQAGKVIAWCLCGTRIDKVYPQTPIAIARLIRECNADVVMMGAPLPAQDFHIAKQIQEHVKEQNGSDRGLHLALSPVADAPSWPIRRILTFASICDLVIGPDTGPMWSVAMEPVAKILLHSHASVTNITKHWINTVSLHADSNRVPCWPCHRLHDHIDTCVPNKTNNGAACISDIAVDSIIETAKEKLHGDRISHNNVAAE